MFYNDLLVLDIPNRDRLADDAKLGNSYLKHYWQS
jgi:hypothetical protein